MGQFNYPHGHGFHYAHNWYPRHQAFGPPPIPNAVPPPPPPPPHDQYFHHAYNGYPPHQAPTPIAPATVPPLPHTWDFHYTDNGYPPHQALRPTVPTVVPPLPHNRDFHYANNGYPPHQGQQPTIPAAIPPHQTPEPTIPAIVSPQKTLEPTIPDVVPIQQLPRNLVCEICDVFFPRRQMEEHKNGKRHRRKVQQQIEYTRRQKTSNGHKAIHTPLDNAGAKDRGFKRNIGEAEVAKGKYMKMNNEIRKPMKSSKPEVNALSISVKSLVQAPELTPSSKGKEHHEIQNPIVEKNDQNQSTPMELRASVVSNVSSGTEDMSCDFAAIAVAQPEKHDLQTEMLEDKDHNEIQRKTVVSNDHQQLISVELHALTSSNINKQTEDANSDSLAIEIEPESFTQPQAVGLSFGPQTELVLHTEMEHQVSDAIACCESEHPAKETDFQMLPSVKGSERKHGDNIGAKDWRFEVEIVSHEAPIFKNKNVPTEGSERKPLDNTGAKDCGFKRKIGEAKVTEGKYTKMNNEIRKPMKSSKPEVNALSISVKSLVQAPELTPSSKGKEHHEIQNPIVEKNDQNQSTPMELRASVVSNVSSGTEDMSCDFAAIAVAQPEKHDLQTKMLEGKDHNEIKYKTMVSNDHRQSIAVHAPAGSNINSQTEDLNSDSPAIAVESQSFAQSDAIACCESQHPAKETDFRTLPSVLMELDVPSGETTNTQTVGESYKDEGKMNVLATELGITQLSQVSVCLKCGDKGFEEALVYCNGCQIYALHRYCLDGPVVINDDVTWFCEDCKEIIVDISHGASNSINLQQQEIICESKVVETSSHDPCSLFPLERSDSENSAKDASQAIIELTNCIKCEKTNKLQNQHIAAEEEVLLLTYRHSPSHHGKSECSNKSEESEEESEADSDEGYVINIDPQPVADPIWRGSLYLRNQDFGTINKILAHVSSLACSKVLEETRLFPHVLCANLLQRSTVWPKSFMESGPDRQSIALYFFPETERVERVFDKLVEEMISKDLAISTMVENAELLIFPSTVLPIQYKRYQAKYYLWGSL